MARRLAAFVYLTGPDGQTVGFGPADTCIPSWAEEQITNPKAWASDEPAQAPTRAVEAPAEADGQEAVADVVILTSGSPEEVQAWLAGTSTGRIIAALDALGDEAAQVDIATALLDFEQGEGGKDRKGLKAALQDLIDA